MADFTVVIPYRPRTTFDSWPYLKRVLDSITVPILVSVYGDMDDNLSSYNVPYIHTPTNKIWNRARANNIGAQNAPTDYVFINDADCIWDGEFVGDRISQAFDKEFHVVYRVESGGRINEHGAGMQGYNKNWPIKWDEQYQGYGREDIDMFKQAKKQKLNIKDIQEGGIKHLDHPRIEMPSEWAKNRKKFNKKWSGK